MRDIVLATIIFGSLPFILARPWVGVIMWNWISFMNPHRMGWGFMFDMPVAMIVGVTLLIAWVLMKGDRKIPWNLITVLMALFIVWTSVTTYFALQPDQAFDRWKQFIKVIVMVFVALSIIKEEKHLRVLIWTIVVSIGYFSFKGGIFTAQTAGNFKVWGPPNTMIADNNALALATLMIIPFMLYLAQTTAYRWVKFGLYAAAFFSLISSVGSQSRGAFVGLAAVGLFLWLKSQRKLITGVVLAVLIGGGLNFLPQSWFDRMNTIQTYEQDESAVGRLEMWQHAIRLANDRSIVGGGFGAFGDQASAQRLSPGVHLRAAHSIYFETLAYHGYFGLFIFLLLGSSGFLMAYKIRRLAKGRPGFERDYKFANYIQISLIAYAVSGTFLSLAHYDLYYTILAIIALKYVFVQRKIKAEGTRGHMTETPVPDGLLQSPQPAGMPSRSFLRSPGS